MYLRILDWSLVRTFIIIDPREKPSEQIEGASESW